MGTNKGIKNIFINNHKWRKASHSKNIIYTHTQYAHSTTLKSKERKIFGTICHNMREYKAKRWWWCGVMRHGIHNVHCTFIFIFIQILWNWSTLKFSIIIKQNISKLSPTNILYAILAGCRKLELILFKSGRKNIKGLVNFKFQ